MEIYNLKKQRSGDTFKGVTIQIKVNNVAKNLTNTEIKIDFKYNYKRGRLVKSLSVNSGITVLDAAEGRFRIDPFVVDFEEGIYYYDVQFTDGSVVNTYVGGTWEIEQDVTD